MANEVLVADAGPLRILSLNRPERRNALNAGLLQGLLDNARLAEADPAVTAVLLRARARELYLKPRAMTADEALALGLVTEVVDDARLDEAAQAFALELAHGPSVTLGYIKRNLNFALSGSLEAALDLEAAHHVQSSLTEDHREAAAAFVEKRAPVFKGR